MRRVLVTGATGFLGHYVIKELLKNDVFEVVAIGGRPEDKVNTLPKHPKLQLIPLEELFQHSFTDIETAINCAFPRSNNAMLLAQALDFTEKLIKRFAELNVRSVINLSSQGVYKRLPVGELSTEDSPIEPIDQYSMAKYASEKLFSISTVPYVTNVRLASLMMPQRFLYLFVQKALGNEPFVVTAPNQYASLLDATDAASGLVALTLLAPKNRAEVYNLGLGAQYSLLEYAEGIRKIGCEFGYEVSFEVCDNESVVCAGMNCDKIKKHTGWKPVLFKDEMIRNLFIQLLYGQ